MSAVKKNETHLALIGLGSNIDPETHIVKAAAELRRQTKVLCASSIWQSPSVGASGPDFLNATMKIETRLDEPSLKAQVLHPLEAALGRVRGEDKNAPRTIDLDLLVFDGQVLDEHIWDYPHLAVPTAECEPGLRAPDDREIVAVAAELRSGASIRKIDLPI